MRLNVEAIVPPDSELASAPIESFADMVLISIRILSCLFELLFI